MTSSEEQCFVEEVRQRKVGPAKAQVVSAGTYIGTSGWHYDHWVGPFYPSGFPKDQARLHPETRVAHLDGSTLEELHKEIWRVLETAIEREADPHKLPEFLPALPQARRREVPAGQR